MADFTRNLDAFDPNWLLQLSRSSLGSGFSSFLDESRPVSLDSFCPSCRRFPSAADDEDHLARHLSAISLLRNRRPALNPAMPPPPAGLYLQRLKTAAIAAAAAATVRENNNSAGSAYQRLPRVSRLGFNGGAPSSSTTTLTPPPPPEQLRPRKVANGHAAPRSDPFEVHIRKPYQSGGYSSSTRSRSNYPEGSRDAGSGGAVSLQKQKTRPIQTRVYPFQGNRSGLPRAGNLGSKESAGSGTGVFIPLAPPDSAADYDYFRSKLPISGKQRRVPRHVGGRAAAGGGEMEVAGGKHSSSMEEGRRRRRRSSSVDQKGEKGGGGEEEEDCHYHLPPDLLMGLPRDWTY